MSCIFDKENLKFFEVSNLEFSEHLIVWGARNWVACNNNKKNPTERLNFIYSKYGIEDLTKPLSDIMKLTISYSIIKEIIMPSTCCYLAEGEISLLNSISYIQNRIDDKAKKNLSKFLPNFILLHAFKLIIKIGNVLSSKDLFLPLRGEINLDESSYTSKYKYH